MLCARSSEPAGALESSVVPILAPCHLQVLLLQLPAGFFDMLLAADFLDGGQTDALRDVHHALQQEYMLRRRMLIERAKVSQGRGATRAVCA